MKPYKAKSLKGAEAMVRRLRKQILERDELLERFDHELKMLAKLAADSPQFSKPFEVMKAREIRNQILNSLNIKTEQ